MAQMTNRITIEGNLVADVDLRFTTNGKAVAKGRIASTRTYEVGGDEREDTTFISFELWGRSAEVFAERFSKGDRVTLVGRLAQDTWETEDGQRRSAYKISVSDVLVSGLWSRLLNADDGSAGEPTPEATAEIEPGDAPF